MSDVPEHEQRETLHIDVEYPEHVERGAGSTEFEHNRDKLLSEHGKCFSCGATDKLEAHHVIIEWAEAEWADWSKVLEAAKKIDPYGYSASMGDKPITDPDDLRNLLLLCVKCHRGAGTGIHLVPFPNWISQVVVKDGDIVLKRT